MYGKGLRRTKDTAMEKGPNWRRQPETEEMHQTRFSSDEREFLPFSLPDIILFPGDTTP